MYYMRNYSQVEAFVKYNFLCITSVILEQFNKFRLEDVVADSPMNLTSISSAYIMHHVWRIFAHSPGRKMYQSSSAFVVVDVKPHNSYRLTFWRLESRKLKWPYTSDCFDYTTTGFESQSHCINECMLQASIKQYQMVPYSCYANHSINYPKPRHVYDITVSAFFKTLPAIEKQCKLRCRRQDCLQEQYFVMLAGIQNSSDKFTVRIALSAPVKPDTVTIEKPQIELIELVTFVLTTIGFSLAFSPLTSLMKLAGALFK